MVVYQEDINGNVVPVEYDDNLWYIDDGGNLMGRSIPLNSVAQYEWGYNASRLPEIFPSFESWLDSTNKVVQGDIVIQAPDKPIAPPIDYGLGGSNSAFEGFSDLVSAVALAAGAAEFAFGSGVFSFDSLSNAISGGESVAPSVSNVTQTIVSDVAQTFPMPEVPPIETQLLPFDAPPINPSEFPSLPGLPDATPPVPSELTQKIINETAENALKNAAESASEGAGSKAAQTIAEQIGTKVVTTATGVAASSVISKVFASLLGTKQPGSFVLPGGVVANSPLAYSDQLANSPQSGQTMATWLPWIIGGAVILAITR